ncbi:hypothetical protein [Streptomyces sp. NRRL F-4474]|uniref:hypothetical protein n=1 Tax=Streptomyces sp. NRRL F-4474 TaxID=1463851 RepID=UPI0004C93CE7|nr:hypothetical protein [Streptomyces sp. NRRL F-4474]
MTAATPLTRPGWILTRGTGRDKRCIALAGKGTPPGISGTQINVDEALRRTTFNHHILKEGLASYPRCCTSLFPELRANAAASIDSRCCRLPPGQPSASDPERTERAFGGEKEQHSLETASRLRRLFDRAASLGELARRDPGRLRRDHILP